VRATIEVIRAILILGVAIFVTIHTGNKLRFYAFMMMLVSSVPSALFIIYCKVSYKAITKWEFQSDVAKYKEMLNFSVWIMFGAVSSVAKNQGTSLIINSFFGTVLNAAFGIAHQIDSLVRMIASNLGQAVVPQITKSFSGGNQERSIKLVAYTSKYTCFLMLIPAIPILLETEYLLTLWVKNVPPYTVIFSQLMVLGALVDSLGGGIAAIVQATGKIKYFQIILSTTSLLSLPIVYFLFKAGYPPSYLIIAFLSTSVLNVVLRQILLKKLINFDVKYFIETSYFKIFYVVIMLLPLFYIKTLFNPGLPRFILLSFFSVSWVLFVIYFIGIEKKEKTMIKQIGFNLLSFRK
jgi:O-antigen/teichoic acid export membrane protein